MRADYLQLREKNEREFLGYLPLLSESDREALHILLGQYIDEMNADMADEEFPPC